MSNFMNLKKFVSSKSLEETEKEKISPSSSSSREDALITPVSSGRMTSYKNAFKNLLSFQSEEEVDEGASEEIEDFRKIINRIFQEDESNFSGVYSSTNRESSVESGRELTDIVPFDNEGEEEEKLENSEKISFDPKDYGERFKGMETEGILSKEQMVCVKLSALSKKKEYFVSIIDKELNIYTNASKSQMVYSTSLVRSSIKVLKGTTLQIGTQHSGRMEIILKTEEQLQEWKKVAEFWCNCKEDNRVLFVERLLERLIDKYVETFSSSIRVPWEKHLDFLQERLQAGLIPLMLKAGASPKGDENEKIHQTLIDYKNLSQRHYSLRENSMRILFPLLRKLIRLTIPVSVPDSKDFSLAENRKKIPKMNIVMLVVGSRGDCQPFLALAMELVKEGHAVRLATHECFRNFVETHGIEFFQLAGDPKDLMEMMSNTDISDVLSRQFIKDAFGRRRKWLKDLFRTSYNACTETWDRHGVNPSLTLPDGNRRPYWYRADLILANPPSFAGPHLAEGLGIPLHFCFTMPWTPTNEFCSPFLTAPTGKEPTELNLMSYSAVDKSMWLWSRDTINQFRDRFLSLPPVYKSSHGSKVLKKRRIPFIYCFSNELIQKPKDWGSWIDVVGFWFLETKVDYIPAPDLQEFLDAGEPPVFIGFGSIVVDEPEVFTKKVINAAIKTERRTIIQSGWTSMDNINIEVPDYIKIIGPCPHDWLFPLVKAVVHHGGAGTTSAGLLTGKPTVVVPFFGDQFFWGKTIARAGLGPDPVPYTSLTISKLASAIDKACDQKLLERCSEISKRIDSENGLHKGLNCLYKHLPINAMKDDIVPGELARITCEECQLQLSYKTDKVLHFSEDRPEMQKHVRHKLVHIDWTSNKPLMRARGFHGDVLDMSDYFIINEIEVDENYKKQVWSTYDSMNKDNLIEIPNYAQANPGDDVMLGFGLG